MNRIENGVRKICIELNDTNLGFSLSLCATLRWKGHLEQGTTLSSSFILLHFSLFYSLFL